MTDTRIKELEWEVESLAHQLNRQKQWKDAMRDKMVKLEAERDALTQDRDEWKEATIMANDNARREEQRRRDMQEERDAAILDARRYRWLLNYGSLHLFQRCATMNAYDDVEAAIDEAMTGEQ